MSLQKMKVLIIFTTPIVIFILLFSKIDVLEFVRSLKEINIALLLAGMLISIFTNIFVASIQWLKILSPLGCSITLKETMLIKLGSMPAKFLLPLRTGELIEAFYLKRQKWFPISLGVSSLFIKILSNLLVLLIVMSFGYIFFFFYNNNFFYLGLFCLGLSLVCMLAIVFFKLIKRFALYLAKRINFRFYNSIEALFKIYKRLKLKDLVAMLSYSVIFWVGEFATFWVAFKALGLDIPLYAILIFVPLTILISNLPITIFGLGTREATIVFCFSKFGSSEKLLSSGLILSFIQFFLPLILSLFFVKGFLNKLFNASEFSQVT
ncbi:MAG: flippase-like domain-containing protein [Candidatus Omnitrophica bacterium]|nr:flippase-like domain-containing protein [Candidatus Omnitrophota bacterium]